MYFPYADHSPPSLAGVGAYHLAQASTPVTQVSAFGAMPAGYSPIRSPWYLDYETWPYIKGPNYTRPVFREHMGGAFAVQPIVRMPALRGFGAEEGASAPPPSPVATIESACAGVKELKDRDIYNRCLEFNLNFLRGTPAEQAIESAAIEKARSTCEKVEPFDAWAKCFYSRLMPKWYEQPLYLGGTLVAGGLLLGLFIYAVRKQDEY